MVYCDNLFLDIAVGARVEAGALKGKEVVVLILKNHPDLEIDQTITRVVEENYRLPQLIRIHRIKIKEENSKKLHPYPFDAIRVPIRRAVVATQVLFEILHRVLRFETNRRRIEENRLSEKKIVVENSRKNRKNGESSARLHFVICLWFLLFLNCVDAFMLVRNI